MKNGLCYEPLIIITSNVIKPISLLLHKSFNGYFVVKIWKAWLFKLSRIMPDAHERLDNYTLSLFYNICRLSQKPYQRFIGILFRECNFLRRIFCLKLRLQYASVEISVRTGVRKLNGPNLIMKYWFLLPWCYGSLILPRA